MRIPEEHQGCDLRLESMRGVSGGPVIGVRGNNAWVVGVQAEWLPESRVVAWQPVDLVRRYVEVFGKWLAAGRPTKRDEIS